MDSQRGDPFGPEDDIGRRLKDQHGYEVTDSCLKIGTVIRPIKNNKVYCFFKVNYTPDDRKSAGRRPPLAGNPVRLSAGSLQFAEGH